MPHSPLKCLAGIAMCVAALSSGSAWAAPVTATFGGQIVNLREGDGGPLGNDFPVGTTVTATVNFLDGVPGVALDQPAVNIAASGELVFGSAVYTVTGARVGGRSLAGAPTVADYWGFIISASGPDTDDGARFYGFLWYLNATLDDFYGSPPQVPLQAAWVSPTGAVYAANIEGRLSMQPAAVSAPPTAALALLALVALAHTRRRHALFRKPTTASGLAG